MTRSAKKAGGQERSDRGKARKSTPPIIDPYLPGNGNFGYRVSRYELELEYKVSANRLSGAATITAATLAALKTFTLDPFRKGAMTVKLSTKKLKTGRHKIKLVFLGNAATSSSKAKVIRLIVVKS